MSIINELFGPIPGLIITDKTDNVINVTFNNASMPSRSFTLTGVAITDSFKVGEYLLAIVEKDKPMIIMRWDGEEDLGEVDLNLFLLLYSQTTQYLNQQPIPLCVHDYDPLNGTMCARINGTVHAIVFSAGPGGQLSVSKH